MTNTNRILESHINNSMNSFPTGDGTNPPHSDNMESQPQQRNEVEASESLHSPQLLI